MISISKHLLPFILACLLTGCGTTEQPKAAFPVAPPPVVKPQPTPSEPPKPDLPPEPVKSPELTALLTAMDAGNADDIARTARTIIDKDPRGEDAVTAYRALAECELSTASPATARLYIERAAELAPKDARVAFVYGNIAHAQANDDEALTHYETAANADTHDASACIASAAIFLTYLDLEKALDRSNCAIEREPTRCDAIAIRADTLYAAKQFEDAATYYERYLSANCALSEDVMRRLAKLNETHLGNAKRACEVYGMLVELRPDDPNYAASRAYQCGL